VRGVYEPASSKCCGSGCAARRSGSLGAHEWRNLEEDLPADFEIHRAEHYDKLHEPLDPRAFTRRAARRDVHRARREEAMRHGTSMALEGNYVDSHGRSEIGFAITRLLDFDLLPRIKQINAFEADFKPCSYQRLRDHPTRARELLAAIAARHPGHLAHWVHPGARPQAG
jgi:hypothetical protein